MNTIEFLTVQFAEKVSMIKLMVCGSRSITDKDFIYKAIEKCVAKLKDDVIIIEGEARGVDSIAKQWAIDHGKQIESYPAKWDLYGKSAGYRRNLEMIKASDDITQLSQLLQKAAVEDLSESVNKLQLEVFNSNIITRS